MFWGLIMEPGRCYTQLVKLPFHISMAALDISNSSNDSAQVMCVFEGRNYLLCTLNKKDAVQCALDLNFQAGSNISFATNGKAHVHLTGYLHGGEDSDYDSSDEEGEIKKSEKGKGEERASTKKSTLVEEEESSDEDFEVNDALMEEAEEVDEEEESDEEEEEDSDSLSSAEEIVEEKKSPPVIQNGTTKPNPAKKNTKNVEVKPATNKIEKEKPAQIKATKKVIKGGVIIQDIKEGNGEIVKEGKFVHVYYEGRLKDSHKVFDSTTKGPGFRFRVGKGEVIKGWDLGLIGMKVGGKRRITCPPKMAYGADGSPPVIPPNAILVFDVEVKKVN